MTRIHPDDADRLVAAFARLIDTLDLDALPSRGDQIARLCGRPAALPDLEVAVLYAFAMQMEAA